MEVTEQVYSWLLELRLAPQDLEPNSQGKIQLEQDQILKFETGENFSVILKHLNQVRNGFDRLTTPMPEIHTMKEATNASTKLYNWNIIAKAMELCGVTLDQDIKSLIVAGDSALISEVLDQLYAEVTGAQPRVRSSAASDRKRGGAPSQAQKQGASGKYRKAKVNPDGGILIDSIDIEKPLFEADSCLEFLILSFCHNFKLQAKQAVGLLTQGNKYLSQVVAKGLKGDFDAILFWIQDIYSNVERLVDLIQEEIKTDSLKLVLNALKTGMLSKHVEAVRWTYRVFTKVSLEFAERSQLEKVWEWFSGDNGGIELVLMTAQRFKSDVTDQLLEFLLHVAQFSLLELFTLKLRNMLPKITQYVALMHDFLPFISKNESFGEEIETSGVLSYWIELCLKEIDLKRTISVQVSCLNFLVDIWLLFVSKFENNEFVANSIINVLTKLSRDESSFVLQTTSFAQMFKLLLIFAEDQNPYAPIIYKTLTFLLVENHNDSNLREFILTNFKHAIETVKTIPISILVEPLVKRIQVSEGSSYVYNTFDMDFLVAVTQHPRLGVKGAILLIDLLAKIYLDDLVYARSAFLGFSNLAFRFIETQAMQDFLFMYSKIGVNLILQMERQKPTPNPKQVGEQALVAVEDSPEVTLYKRDFILDMICWILQLEAEELNEKLKELMITSNQEYRKQHRLRDYKGFQVVLSYFGEPAEVTAAFYEEHPELAPPPTQAQKKAAAAGPSMLNRSVDSAVKHKSPSPEPKKVDKSAIVAVSQDIVPSTEETKKRKSGFPWKRANADIEKAKARRAQLDKQKREEEEAAAKRLEINKKKLKKQLEIRKIEFKVNRGSTGDNLVFQEGLASTNLVSDEFFVKEWEFPAEKEDYNAVQLVLKKYARVFKVLFENYSGTGFERKMNSNQSEFEWLAERKKHLNQSELVKIFSDFKVIPKLCTKEDIVSLLKVFCAKITKQIDNYYVVMEHWPSYFAQLSYFIYSRPKNLLCTYPYVLQVKNLVDYMRNSAHELGKPTEIYDEPDPGTGDRDVCRKLNQQLAHNPKTKLPEGYQRVAGKDIQVVFEPPEQLPDSLKVAYSIMDHVMFRALNFHLFEPQVQLETVYYAKGVPKKKIEVQQVPIYERPLSQMRKSTVRERSHEPHGPSLAAAPKGRLGPTLKLCVANSDLADQALVTECAFVLEDLIHSLELKMNRIINRHTGPGQGKPINRIQRQREEERIREEQAAKVAEARRRRHMDIIAREIASGIEDKNAKIMEEKAKAEAEQAEREAAQRKKQEIFERERQKRVEELKRWKEWKEAEEAKREEESKAQQRPKPAKTDLTKFQERARSDIAKKAQQVKAQKEAEQYVRQRTEEVTKKSKSSVIQNLEAEKRKRAEEQKAQEEFEEFAQIAQPTLERFTQITQVVFDFYVKQTIGLGEELQTKIVFQDLNKFCSNFLIIPDLISLDEMKKIHKKVTKNQADSLVDYNGFCQFLLRVAVASREFFSKPIGGSGSPAAPEGPPTARDLETFLGYLGFNASKKEMKARLTEVVEQRPANRKTTQKRITKVSSGEIGNQPMTGELEGIPERSPRPPADRSPKPQAPAKQRTIPPRK